MSSNTQQSPTTKCQYPGCTKTVWKDPDGSYSLFCGNAHRFAMVNLVVNNPPTRSQSGSQSQMCKNCNAKPVYIENGHAHDFCGRRCAEQFNKNGQRIFQSRSPTANSDLCTIPGCPKSVYVSADGSKSKFCSIRHRITALQSGIADACLGCKEMPTVLVDEKLSDFCSKRCSTAALSKVAPTILEIPITNKAYQSVQKQFTDQWKHPTPVPTVIKIWKIFGERSVLDQYFRYQLEVEQRTGIPGANTRRRFHGTIRACCLGDTSNDGALCSLSTCNMCSIIRSFYKIAYVGIRTNFGRFGNGIYTSATSSKANDYSTGSASANRAMLLNDVVMGKAIKLTTTDTSLTEPPGGHDAVIGEPGGNLNYDEAIVYRNDAIRPSFLIIYK